MSSRLRWFLIHPPRDLELEDVTRVLRPLANRPRIGLLPHTPVVVFEVASHAGEITWRVGADYVVATDVVAQLSAHLPQVGVVAEPSPDRPVMTLAADLRTRGLAGSLRLDTAEAVSAGVIAALQALSKDEAAVVQWVVGPAHRRQAPPLTFDIAVGLGLRNPTRPEATISRLWREKAAEAVFGCRGRIGATATTPDRAGTIIRRLGSALRLADAPHTRLQLGVATRAVAARLQAANAPLLTWGSILNSAELAVMVAWPLGEINSDGLPVTGGHIGPAPKQLLVAVEDDDKLRGKRVLGTSLHPAERDRVVTVPVSTSTHHLHLVGPTGAGKSTILVNFVLADIAAGHGVFVVEPKGDLVEDLLTRIPEDRQDDVVVIDPAQGDRVVGLDVLGGDAAQAERRADQIVSLLAEMHGPNWGPRTADVALHALITVSRLPGGSLPDVVVILTNPTFRRAALAKASDNLVLGPWWAWYDGLSEAERSHVISPLLNKLRAFLSRDALRRMVGQAEPRFSLEEVFTGTGKVVLININRGLLGPETASLLGALILTQAWSAIQRRASLPPGERHPVMMVIDEWQDYLRLPGLDFGDALAQARGLGVGLALSHQHLDQLSATQRAAILANARSRASFRPAPGDARALAAAFGGAVTADDLLRLKAYEACCQLHVNGQPTRPFSVLTRPLPRANQDPVDVRRTSAERYGVDGAAIDAFLTERWQGAAAGEGPIGTRKRRSVS